MENKEKEITENMFKDMLNKITDNDLERLNSFISIKMELQKQQALDKKLQEAKAQKGV